MPRKKPRRRAYDTDLSDGQWTLVEPMIPQAEPGGRPRKAATRDLVDEPVAAGDCCRTIYRLGRRSTIISAAGSAKASGIGSTMRWSWRTGSASAASPHQARRSSTASRCAPPIKKGSKGFDAGKKISGRKRHILTDTNGRLLTVHVHGADIQDRDGGKGVLKRSRKRYPVVQCAYADGGYAGRLVEWAKDKTHIVLEIVRRNATAKGFEVLPRRWVVERTFAWIMKNRRFARDYEQLTSVAETLIIIAACATLVRRWP